MIPNTKKLPFQVAFFVIFVTILLSTSCQKEDDFTGLPKQAQQQVDSLSLISKKDLPYEFKERISRNIVSEENA